MKKDYMYLCLLLCYTHQCSGTIVGAKDGLGGDPLVSGVIARIPICNNVPSLSGPLPQFQRKIGYLLEHVT